MLRYKLLIVLFAFGTVAGFASGFRHMAHRRECHREAAKREMAASCAEAARALLHSAPNVDPGAAH